MLKRLQLSAAKAGFEHESTPEVSECIEESFVHQLPCSTSVADFFAFRWTTGKRL